MATDWTLYAILHSEIENIKPDESGLIPAGKAYPSETILGLPLQEVEEDDE